MRRTFSGSIARHCDASTSRTCDMPPKRKGTERAMRRRMTVSTGDRHAGLCQAELGTDHVHDALIGAGDVVEWDAELAAVLLERRHHFFGEHVRRLIERWHDVIDGRECRFGNATRLPRLRSISNA